MGISETIAVLASLHRDHFSRAGEGNIGERIREFLDEDGFDEETPCPAWFDQMIVAIRDRKAMKVSIDRTSFDLSCVLLELHEQLGWDIDDYGEGVQLSFAASRVWAFIGREGRGYFEVFIRKPIWA